MNCDVEYTWCPEDSEGAGRVALSQWLEEKMGREWRNWWMDSLDRIQRNWKFSTGLWLVRKICELDAAEMVELLFPVMPDLFLLPRRELVQDAELNAVAYCALYGSVACLEKFLELGADPNGMDCVKGENRVRFPNSECVLPAPVTLLDCARATGEEECCFVLEMHGGVTIRELCGIPEEEFPLSFPGSEEGSSCWSYHYHPESAEHIGGAVCAAAPGR